MLKKTYAFLRDPLFFDKIIEFVMDPMISFFKICDVLKKLMFPKGIL